MSEQKKKRNFPLRINEPNAKKLEEMADRYGMSINSLVSFIVGQWLDSNYDLKDYAREKMIPAIADKMEPEFEKMISNPQFLEMMKEMVMYENKG
ncbi:hypothetical protein [Oceanobacillus sp. J11TS1]|uniref:hypothetical protein n=1 Tax=Oceanobacillus sp. J11TS1 TaxID=2807191 RepID=UPI001B0D13E8|nr:hypothetical protein [Oceanobacillus sp. J11TS1]GIO25346.1 hypothetical protein J11TS1_39270 [Oceanobacillus sp. J11TS1]